MSAGPGRLAVLVLNFGEPVEASETVVVEYLERIFLQNRSLEAGSREAGEEAPGSAGSVRTAAAAASARTAARPDPRERARQLARARAPGLLDVYRRIGPSPLNAQADAQTRALQAELRARDLDARAYSAFQFTPPSIEEQVRRARADGADTLVALPLYPLCGRSTSVAALDAVEEALGSIGWAPRFAAVTGWHHHPRYVALRVDGVRRFVEDEGIDLEDPDALLHFSVHGTPVRYLDEGNRYDRYVEEHCRAVAGGLGATRWAVGFQNHTNRPVEWTQPDNEDRIREAPERRLVVVPISFMHEQSETLAELDVDLRAFVEALGKEMHRVPVPHADARFPVLLADLVEEALAPGGRLAPCRCRPARGTWCTNGGRDLPPSPYAGAARG